MQSQLFSLYCLLSAAEIAAELEQDEKDKGGATMGATVKLRERTYMGMFEYRREDEGALIKNLILGTQFFHTVSRMWQHCIPLDYLLFTYDGVSMS